MHAGELMLTRPSWLTPKSPPLARTSKDLETARSLLPSPTSSTLGTVLLLPDIGSHAGDVSGEYPREHERRCRHRVHPRRACCHERVPIAQAGRRGRAHETVFLRSRLRRCEDAPVGRQRTQRRLRAPVQRLVFAAIPPTNN